MGKRRKQAKLAVASTGRVELTDASSKRSGRPERSPSPATLARLERAKKAQRSSLKYHKPTWRDEQEQGRIVDEGEAITSSSEDDDPGLVETFDLVDDEAEEATEDEESSEGEVGHLRRRRRGHEGSDSDSDEQPTPRRTVKKSRRTAREIVLSSDDDDEIVARTTPVASTSKCKAASAARENGGSPPKRKVLVFHSLEISPPPTKRRAVALNNKGSKADSANEPKTNAGKAHPAQASTAEETPEEERMSIALGNPQDTADESDEHEQPVKGPGSSARKRSRVSSSSDESSSGHRSSTTNTSDGEVDDDLPLPASIAAANKRLKAKRETTLNNAALRSPRKPKTGKVRKVDTKRKLTALSQGVRDRRSEDEESDEEDFVVDDDDAIIYDTTTDEDDAQPPASSKKQKKAAKRKGKERAVTEEDEEQRPVSKKKERKKGKSRKQVQLELLATDSEDEQLTRSASKRKYGKKKGGRVVRSDTDHDDDEEAVQRKKRKRRRRRVSESEDESNSDEEDDGIDDGPEDLEILDEETVLDQKFRTRQTNESKFASLKAARDRRKASQKAIVLDSEDERPATQSRSQRGPTGSQPRFLGDPDHNSDEEDDSEDSDSDGRESGSGSDSSSSRTEARSDGEGSIDDFLAEDDGHDEEVEKYRADLQMKSQGMRYYYKTYIILLVYMIIDPDRDWRREDKELRMADEKVTQELEGLLNSLVGSSAWKPKFQHVIDTRPELTVDPLDGDEAGGPCGVCTMGRSRHASSLLTLFGPKYNRKTLQDLVSAEDSSAEEESDSENENAGRKSRDKYYTFHSGGTCTMRAEFYHQLRHWAHSTRDRVADMLKPLRREIRELETDEMTKKKRKKARKQMTRLKHEEASRLIRILEDGREVEQLTDRLQKEIQQACSAFAKNG